MQNSKILKLLKTQLLELLESTSIPIVISSGWESIIFTNTAVNKLFGYKNEELINKSMDCLIFRNLNQNKNNSSVENERVPISLRDKLYGKKKNGRKFPLIINMGLTKDNNSTLMIFLLQDITKEKEYELNYKLFRTLLNQSMDTIEILDSKTGQFLEGNRTAWKVLGYKRKEFLNLNISDVDPSMTPMHFKQTIKKLQKHKGITLASVHKRKDGSKFPVEINVKYVKLEKEYLVAVARDITKICRANEEIIFQTTHNPITKLPNLNKLQEVIKKEIHISPSNKNLFGLIMFKINKFKDILNTIGYTNSNNLLRQVVSRLARTLKGKILLFHTDTYEFTILFSFNKQSDIYEILEKLLDNFRRPFLIKEIPVTLTINCGITTYPKHGKTQKTLIKRARIAIVHAKNRSDYKFYNTKYDTYKSAQLKLISELKYAIEHNKLELYYQPQLNIQTKEIFSVEALIRWQHPNLGLLSPQKFIYLAEQTDLIHTLGLWVIKDVIKQHQIWSAKNLNIQISLNISPKNFLNKKFCTKMLSLIKANNKNIKLEIEITETVMLISPVYAKQIMREVRSLGVKIAIDDFGTGYSSLNYLKELPLDTLKIDQCFIKNLLKTAKDEVIVKTIIQLAHDLNLKVIAEGVINKKFLNKLSSMNCDIGQGFYIGKPMKAQELISYLTKFNLDNNSN